MKNLKVELDNILLRLKEARTTARNIEIIYYEAKEKLRISELPKFEISGSYQDIPNTIFSGTSPIKIIKRTKKTITYIVLAQYGKDYPEDKMEAITKRLVYGSDCEYFFIKHHFSTMDRCIRSTEQTTEYNRKS